MFTAEREVNAMLDLVKQETERIDSRFLEPACGDGNFLAAVLERKMNAAKVFLRKSKLEYERKMVLAVASLYGVDILRDNVEICCERVYDTLSGPLQKLWEQLSVTDAAVRTYCVTASTDRYAAAIAEDLLADWHYLTRENFLSTHVAISLSSSLSRHSFSEGGTDLSRFLRGLQDRLSRLRQQPAARELERITTLHAAMVPEFYSQFQRHTQNQNWLAYGLLLSEYRLSIFAPALAQKGRSSIKKLQAAAEALK